MLAGAQLRGARAMLGWSAGQLAAASKVSLATIQRAEKEDGPVRMTAANIETIRRTLEAAGVEFTDGDALGVRLRKPTEGKGG